MRPRRTMICQILALATAAGCRATATSPSTAENSTVGCNVLADVAAPHHRIHIESIGSPPDLLRQDVIRGCGLTLDILYTNPALNHRYGWSEADPQVVIDYSLAARGIVQVVEFADDVRPHRLQVPFVRRTIAIGDSVTETDQILLQPEAGDAARITCLKMQVIKALSPDAQTESDDAFEVPLIHLRNMGIARPAAVLDAFTQIASKANGAAAESLAGCRREIEIVNSVQTNRPESAVCLTAIASIASDLRCLREVRPD